MDLLLTQVSVYRSSTDKSGVVALFNSVVERIKNGKNGLDEKTEKCRRLSQGDKKVYSEFKQCLPAVIFAGKFKGRKKLETHSGLVVLDFDDIDVGSVMADCATMPETVLAFISPSGAGVKCVASVSPMPSDPDEHKLAWQQVSEHYSCIAEPDPSGKDVTRLCFLSHDPQRYYNPEATPLDVDLTTEEPPEPASQKTHTDIDLNALDYIEADSYEEWLNVGIACFNHGVDISVWDEWSQKSEKYEKGACAEKWKTFKENHPKRLTWGSIVSAAKKNGYQSKKQRADVAFSVEIEGQLRGQVHQAFENLTDGNDPPDIFVDSSGFWSRVLPGDSKITGIKGDAFRLMLAEKMNFYRFNRSGDLIDAAVPRDIALGVEFHRERLQRFPRLDRVINHPILLESGEVLDRQGYIRDNNSWILSDLDLQLTGSVDEAREMLIDPFKNFLFESRKDRANAFAYLFTLLLRERFDLAPFFAVVSHKGGTGKGLLINSLHRIAEGDNLDASTLDRNRWEESEIRRQIMGELLQGRASILIDNLPDGYTLRSTTLEALATTHFFSGKVIYRSERPAFRTWPVWVFTGNNIQFGGMLPRRIQKIAITANVEDPHLRELPDLGDYVRQYRDTLLGAAFSLMIAWQEAGKPEMAVHLGSFERWGRIIGGLLEFAGIEGFDPTLAEKSDEEMANREFIFDLYSEFSTGEFSVRDVLGRVIDSETNQGSLSLEGVIDLGVKNVSQSLGYLLKKLGGQVFTDRGTGTTIKLVKVDGSSRPVKYTFDSPMQHTDEIDEIPF